MARRWEWVAGCLAAGLTAFASEAWSADNLVFVPLTPCRVIDTRVPGAGGPLVAGTPRTFLFRGPTRNYQSVAANQGGSTTGCGIPDTNTDPPSILLQNIAQAVAINIVAVAPAGGGDLRAWPADQSVPLASVINYAAVSGLNLANGVIVPMCHAILSCLSGDITFRADVSGTHLVVDVVGYFTGGAAPGTPSPTMTNVALGPQALQANTTGIHNSAFGFSALNANTSGSYDTAIGDSALLSNDSGTANTAVGTAALKSNTGGYSNTAIGLSALLSNIGGSHNLAAGGQALANNTSGHSNTAVGYMALRFNSTGYRNSAVGFKALGLSTGNGNTAIGRSALYNTTGNYNIAVGSSSGINATNGNANVFIANAGLSGDDGTIRIGNTTFHSRTFIAAIRGVTTDAADGVPVLVDSNGQLGTGGASTQKLTPLAAPPDVCDATHEGEMYADTSHALCFCDGSSWLLVVGAGTCS